MLTTLKELRVGQSATVVKVHGQGATRPVRRGSLFGGGTAPPPPDCLYHESAWNDARRRTCVVILHNPSKKPSC